MLVDPTSDSLVACAGYKYKSRWTANENRAPANDSTYYRQYPRNDTAFVWWNDSTANCLTTFGRDSLYVVGGKLTILGEGSLKAIADPPYYIWNIDNTFSITTDTLATTNHDTLRTKMILIDKDPLNSQFLIPMQYDIIKATAWKEGAGTLGYPPHHAQSKLNHYWNDTKTPCENGSSTATGIMQIMRTTWDSVFAGLRPFEPVGYDTCSWDSLAWNWKITEYNGKYIYLVNNYHYINLPTNPQRLWDTLYFPESDYTPDIPNKEDLSSYGYKVGATKMRAVKDSANWVIKVMNYSDVVNTRKFKHERPWQ